MNVWIVDERLYNDSSAFNAYLESLNRMPNLVAFGVNQDWSMHRICTRARQRSGGRIGVLVIDCHGNSSSIQFGTGLRVPADTTHFQLLRGSWVGDYPRIEVQACATISSTPICGSVAATLGCTPGNQGTINNDPTRPEHRLMQAIADNAGILVIASYDAQTWSPGFEGRIRHYRPREYYRLGG